MTQVSLIVPTLNVSEYLQTCFSSHRKCLDGHLQDVVVAGVATSHVPADVPSGVTITQSAKGRGTQLKLGAEAATGDYLLFLHDDTHLSEDAHQAIQAFIQTDQAQDRLGFFRFRVDDESDAAKRLEARVDWRCKTFALPYGDQGFLISRKFYDSLGGFRDMPLMEDVDLIWRIERRFGKARIVPIEADAITNAEKFVHDGYRWRSTKNLFCLFLFWIGISPRLISRIY